jgi:hypothetical protein
MIFANHLQVLKPLHQQYSVLSQSHSFPVKADLSPFLKRQMS